MSFDIKRFLVKIRAPVVILEEEPLFQNEAVNKGYVDDLISLKGLPAGGDYGQILQKSSADDYSVIWANNAAQVQTTGSNISIHCGTFDNPNAKIHCGTF